MADGWTLKEALEQFAAAGMPVDADRFRLAVTRVARIPAVSHTPSGAKGGRGYLMYDIGQLQRLHSALAPWLAGTPETETHDAGAVQRRLCVVNSQPGAVCPHPNPVPDAHTPGRGAAVLVRPGTPPPCRV